MTWDLNDVGRSSPSVDLVQKGGKEVEVRVIDDRKDLMYCDYQEINGSDKIR